MKLINIKDNNILIDKNINEPIIFVYDLNKIERNSFKITVEEGIKASFIEVIIGDEKKELQREIIINKNANLEYLKYQDLGKQAHISTNYKIILEENASLNMTNIEIGLGKNSNTFITNLEKQNAKLNINGLVKLYQDTNSSSIFKTKHIAQGCISDIKYKHSLHDKSKAIFDAKSIVEEKANFSKVFQNSNTILLSDDAIIKAQPHLEINIDELEAKHGATTGSINKEQLLYLQAKGIPKKLAYEMLLKAFENEIYDNIKNKKIKDFIKNFERSDYV